MKKPGIMAVLLFLTSILCIAFLLFFTHGTYQKIVSTEEDVKEVTAQIQVKQEELNTAKDNYTAAIEQVQTNVKRLRQKAKTASQQAQRERADVETETKPSVFSQGTGSGEPTFTTGTDGHIIAIDPGHQSEQIDMSALEPNGPGSSEMKAKCSTGTAGSFSGLPEYALNLDVSLKLRDILLTRGYQVVMTRTDNNTAISNKERAEYAASQGAEIYVRIHANGDNDSSISGALSMSPSAQNPYVSHLYEDSNRLSQCIIDSYCSATGFKNLGVHYYDNMTGINWSSVPVTIVEMGFMTNQNDDLAMADNAFQQTMASGIADGIDAYFGR